MKASVNRKDGQPEPDGGQDDNKTIRYLCMKYNRHQVGEEPTCQDPDLYCKFRPSCLVHYMEKRRRRNPEGGDRTEES
jgi:hypothetical protein